MEKKKKDELSKIESYLIMNHYEIVFKNKNVHRLLRSKTFRIELVCGEKISISLYIDNKVTNIPDVICQGMIVNDFEDFKIKMTGFVVYL